MATSTWRYLGSPPPPPLSLSHLTDLLRVKVKRLGCKFSNSKVKFVVTCEIGIFFKSNLLRSYSSEITKMEHHVCELDFRSIALLTLSTSSFSWFLLSHSHISRCLTILVSSRSLTLSLHCIWRLNNVLMATKDTSTTVSDKWRTDSANGGRKIEKEG